MLVDGFSEMTRESFSRRFAANLRRSFARSRIGYPISLVAECHLTASARLSLYPRYVTRRRTSPEAVEQALIMNAARVDGERSKTTTVLGL
jgi:hypothetical protein